MTGTDPSLIASVVPIQFDIDARLFATQTVKKTAHRLAKRGSFDIAMGDDNTIRVRVTPTDAASALSVEKQFREVLVEQDWRETVSKKTEGLRNLIVAQAFSPFSLIAPETDTSDFHDDVLGIAKPDRAK